MAEYQIIKVRRKHIKAGCRNKTGTCPVALAILEQSTTPVVSVADDYILANSGTIDPFLCFRPLDLEQKAPRSVSRFVRKFDKTGKGEPFSFKWHPEKR